MNMCSERSSSRTINLTKENSKVITIQNHTAGPHTADMADELGTTGLGIQAKGDFFSSMMSIKR